MATDETLESLREENRLLKANLGRLRERLTSLEQEGAVRGKSGASTRLLKLVQEKDRALADMGVRIEKMVHDFNTAVETLGARDTELASAVGAMRLYQQIFESDPSAIIGFDAGRSIVQFNDAAVSLFGPPLREMLLGEVAALSVGLDANEVEKMLEAVLEDGRRLEKTLTINGRRYRGFAFPLKSEGAITGGILRVLEARES